MNIQTIYPFDQTLNNAILRLSAHYVPTFIISDHAPATYRQLKAHLDAGKTMVVAHEGSSHTIFASEQVNFAFRAWHDWCHWKGEYDFSLFGESATCNMQIEQIYAFYGVNDQTQFWAQLLVAEVIGQRCYYERHRQYIHDQRAFATAYMNDPSSALLSKW